MRRTPSEDPNPSASTDATTQPSLVQKRSDLSLSDNKEEAKKKMIERLQHQILRKTESTMELNPDPLDPNPLADGTSNNTTNNTNDKNRATNHKNVAVENSASEASSASHRPEPRAIFRIERDKLLQQRNSAPNPGLMARQKKRDMLLNHYASLNVSSTDVLDFEFEISQNTAILDDRLKSDLHLKLEREKKIKQELEMKLEAEKKMAEEIHYERIRISEKILLEKTLAEDRSRYALLAHWTCFMS